MCKDLLRRDISKSRRNRAFRISVVETPPTVGCSKLSLLQQVQADMPLCARHRAHWDKTTLPQVLPSTPCCLSKMKCRHDDIFPSEVKSKCSWSEASVASVCPPSLPVLEAHRNCPRGYSLPLGVLQFAHVVGNSDSSVFASCCSVKGVNYREHWILQRINNYRI